ncbi:MAG: YlxR family protein [Actinomycetota bacterium]
MTAAARAALPERTCVGCRRRRPATVLVRVVRRGDGSLSVGRTLPGRGAWLCAGSTECLDEAIRRSAFSRAFRAEVAADDAESLRNRLADRAAED